MMPVSWKPQPIWISTHPSTNNAKSSMDSSRSTSNIFNRLHMMREVHVYEDVRKTFLVVQMISLLTK